LVFARRPMEPRHLLHLGGAALAAYQVSCG
jgi:hypothetical protein